jgi:hypothetical protein
MDFSGNDEQRSHFFTVSDEHIAMMNREYRTGSTESLRKRIINTLTNQNDQAVSTEHLRKRIITALMSGHEGPENYSAATGTSVLGLLTAEEMLRLYDDNADSREHSSFGGACALINRLLLNHDLFYTQGGKLTLAPKSTRNNDDIVILHGIDYPVVLRPEGNGTFSVLGECYLEDAMYGEAVSWEAHEADQYKLV